MTDDIQNFIRQTITSNRVVLFMKGTRSMPQDGYSVRAIDTLKRCGTDFTDVNVLTNPALRDGIKEYSNWPTIPQVYIDGKFIGGVDILTEMFNSGELQALLRAG